MANAPITTVSARRDFWWIGGLLAASVAIAFGVNVLRKSPVPLLYQTKEMRLHEEVAEMAQSTDKTSPATKQDVVRVLTLKEFEALRSQALVLDARPTVFYRLGHVPGSLSLPRDDFAKAYELLKSRLDAGRGGLWVVYCASVTCEDAELVRTALRDLGYDRVAVFSGGWTEWRDAGLPGEASP